MSIKSSDKAPSERWNYALPIIVAVYMIIAISWWAVLLYREHILLFDTYQALLEAGIPYQDEMVNLDHMSIQELEALEQRKKNMIFSEALVIGVSILIGLVLMHSAYRRLIRHQRMKQNFLLSVSHELKSPIASIKLSLQSLLKLFHKDELPAKETLSAIAGQGIQEAGRLHTLVTNILTSTRLDAGYAVHHTLVQLEPTIGRWMKRFYQIYPASDIRIQVERSDESVMIDINALELVVSNLIDNALKYGGKPPTVHLLLGGDRDQLDIMVCDNGLGIPEQEQKMVFERFYRIGDERIRKAKGTGLGLYLVNALLQNNDASIDVGKSDLGGACFKIVWPLHPDL